jgi:hypothetical protein
MNMKKLFLTGVAALFLATGAALANEESLHRCGKRLIYVWGHHGFIFALLPKGDAVTAAVVDLDTMNDIDETLMRDVPAGQARFVYPPGNGPGVLYFRGRKCILMDDLNGKAGR